MPPRDERVLESVESIKAGIEVLARAMLSELRALRLDLSRFEVTWLHLESERSRSELSQLNADRESLNARLDEMMKSVLSLDERQFETLLSAVPDPRWQAELRAQYSHGRGSS